MDKECFINIAIKDTDISDKIRCPPIIVFFSGLTFWVIGPLLVNVYTFYVV